MIVLNEAVFESVGIMEAPKDVTLVIGGIKEGRVGASRVVNLLAGISASKRRTGRSDACRKIRPVSDRERPNPTDHVNILFLRSLHHRALDDRIASSRAASRMEES